MTDDDPLKYLPPGWTEEKYRNATDEDFDGLSDEVLERNMARMAAETALQSQEFKKQLNERRAARGAPPMEQAQAERDGKGHPLVRLIEERGWDDFGFMLMRMDYSDDARFDQFRERFSAILDKSIESRNPSEGFERVVDKLFTKIVDDDIMNNTGPVGTSRAFQDFKEEGEIEPGLDTKMCLMTDAESINSVLNPRSDADNRTSPPFVWAVDVNLCNGIAVNSDYQGFFKVAIAALATEFYYALAIFEHASELAPFADPIWQDTLGT